MPSFYLMEAVNLFCGDHDPSASKHLSIEEFKAPDLQEMYQEHHAGGSRVQTEYAVGVSKLEPTFKLKGFDPELLIQFGLSSKRRQVYTAYGVIRDARTGEGIQSKAVIEARLGKAAPDAQKRGEMPGHEYALNEVMHYELTFGGRELIYWDFFTNSWRINGVDESAEENRLLGIAGA